ncbi:hypothetical protein HMPREF9952_0578 [Haemophilus pittmaniae HK 85]|jgi:thioester dehydrase family protein|uniref:Dehydratase n=2 Tax=Haemophilus pittmaniae TaxID=249188 RepID=A0A377IXG9_9PAST|nr:hypothetical protein [Haemophilus pittmaniae]EGV04994.1 hypothetical protein HMPREF9952_0578 [Haemophilus pittmaniae HK 85]SNV64613.1 dehydratase [Haemophilus pittmaniae]STO92961.1 dehydratase [Haemophilus pittmaniae]
MLDLSLPIRQISPLLPHSGKMVLLDKITNFGTDFLEAETTLDEHCLLAKKGIIDSLMGAEIMAQGVAAWAGIQCVKAGKPIGLGYWIGSRKLSIHCAQLPIARPLKISIHLSIEDTSGFGVFDCQLVDIQENQVLVEGSLNVYRPQTA